VDNHDSPYSAATMVLPSAPGGCEPKRSEAFDPSAIEEALLRHEAVAEAAIFLVPHRQFGEELAALVVLRPDAKVAGVALRRHLRLSVPQLKIPRRVRFVSALPRAAGGELLRAQLPALFLTELECDPQADRRAQLEADLLEIWRQLLERNDITIDDEYWTIGGDHRLALRMLVEAEMLVGEPIPESILFDAPSIRELVDCVIEPGGLERVLLMPVQAGSSDRPFFFIDGEFGRGGGYFVRKLVDLLGPDQPWFNLRPYALPSGSLPSYQAMSKGYVDLIKSVQQKGPYRLGGHCNGAIQALEAAEQLRAGGDEVELVIMVEPYSMNARWPLRLLLRTVRLVVPFLGRDAETSREIIGRIMRRTWLSILDYDKKKRAPGAARFDAFYHPTMPPLSKGTMQHLKSEEERLAIQNLKPLASYLPRATRIPIVCVISQESKGRLRFKAAPWRAHFRKLDVVEVPGGHFSCFAKYVEPLAEHWIKRLKG